MQIKNILTIGLLLFVFAGCNERQSKTFAGSVVGHGKMPAVTMAADKTLDIVYGDGDSLMYRYSRDAGATFAPQELVASLPELVASATRGPQIAGTRDGVAIIAVNKDGDIFSYIRDESGKWMSTGKVNDADTTDKEGFIGLSSDGGNNLFAIWPDLRGDRQNKIFGFGLMMVEEHG